MIPGTTSKISESYLACTTSMSPKNDLIIVNSTTSTTVIATVVPPYAGFGGVMFLYNDSGGTISFVTTGNIHVARTVPDEFLVVLCYSNLLDKWLPGAIS